MFPADREEVRATARRYFDAGLCCAVEIRREGRWESRVLAMRSASPEAVLGEVEETLARGARVRLAAYSPSSLTRLDLPAPIVCSRPARRPLLAAGEQAQAALDDHH